MAKSKETKPKDADRTERLQKVLAAAGYGSRRACEELIEEGRVSVNRQTVERLPVLVDPARDLIQVDRRRVRKQHHVYFLLNKPRGVVCTNRDPQGRRRAVDLLQDVHERVYPVGRLDADTTGLIIMTNDGELANQLTHPRYGVPKTYRARVKGKVTSEDIAKLRKGMFLSDGRVSASAVRALHCGQNESHIEITLREGRNRQVRRMLGRLGHRVKRLARVRIGPITDRGIGIGKYRPLTPREVATLRNGPRQSIRGAPKRESTRSSR